MPKFAHYELDVRGLTPAQTDRLLDLLLQVSYQIAGVNNVAIVYLPQEEEADNAPQT